MPESDPPDNRTGRVLPGYRNAELVERLRAAGCAGPLWAAASAELADRGLRSVHRMIRDGSLNSTLARLLGRAQPGRRVEVCPEELADAAGWVGEAVARGLDKFRRDTIEGRGWDARGCPGKEYAELGTWVINTILLQIPDVLRADRSRTGRNAREIPYPPDVLHNSVLNRRGDPVDPVDVTVSAESRSLLNTVLETMRPDVAEVVRLQLATGQSRAACCRQLGRSDRAIEEYLRRWRFRHRGPGEQR